MNNQQSPPVFFYSPLFGKLGHALPPNAEVSWQWMFEQGQPNYGLSDGEYAWSLLTFLRLREYGFPCQVTDTIPERGIVVTHRINLPLTFKPNPNLLFVCLQADKAPHPFAQVSVILNPEQLSYKYSYLGDVHAPTLRARAQQATQNAYFLPHWPLPGLIPRDPQRKDKFENIVFFGVGRSLARELYQSYWKDGVKQLGLNWFYRGPGKGGKDWQDFSDVDAVLAVRCFQGEDNFAWKPATKLYNAWHAGVPAILGWESAYQAERKSDLDYIECRSVDQALDALRKLRDEPDFRRAMVKNGRKRATETNTDILAQKWISFFKDIATPAYHTWCANSHFYQMRFLGQQHLRLWQDQAIRFRDFKIEGIQRRWHTLLNNSLQ